MEIKKLICVHYLKRFYFESIYYIPIIHRILLRVGGS